MPNASHAIQAYRKASRYRSQREQEADVFHHAIAALKGAKEAAEIQKIRALADNRRLWMAILDLVRDGNNSLPPETRAGIISIGRTVQREMDADEPNFDFLITINKHLAEGLSGNP